LIVGDSEEVATGRPESVWTNAGGLTAGSAEEA
jgi:hypothetical protein